MIKALSALCLLVLAGCAGVPYQPDPASPCAVHEASFACQIERYDYISAP